MSAHPTPPAFSIAVLRDTAGGDEPLVQELVAIFLRIAPPMVKRFRQAMADGNAAACAQEAHDLKSSLALLGATSASADCAAIESTVRQNGRLPPAETGARLCDQILEIIRHVDSYAGSSERHDPGAA